MYQSFTRIPDHALQSEDFKLSVSPVYSNLLITFPASLFSSGGEGAENGPETDYSGN